MHKAVVSINQETQFNIIGASCVTRSSIMACTALILRILTYMKQNRCHHSYLLSKNAILCGLMCLSNCSRRTWLRPLVNRDKLRHPGHRGEFMFSVRFRRHRRRNDFASHTKPFELNLRYLKKRKYGPGEIYRMTRSWLWPNITAVISINKNVLVCRIKWEPVFQSQHNLTAISL